MAESSRFIIILLKDRFASSRCRWIASTQSLKCFWGGESFAESADFSRDGHYVVYVSPETGQREIYLRPYPGPGGRQTISVDGGREPVLVDSGEVFYRNATGEKFFAVSIATKPMLTAGQPRMIFQGPYYVPRTGSPRAQYDVTANGQRFLVLAPSSGTDASARPRIVVVQNWFDELRRRLPKT